MLRQYIARTVSLSSVFCGSFYNNKIYMANSQMQLDFSILLCTVLLPFDYDLVWVAKEMFSYTSSSKPAAFPLLPTE